MEAMSAPPPTRHAPFLQQQGLRIPSLPIPIPARRVATDPPPRSPDRECSSSDLVFEMSPIALEDAPIQAIGSQRQESGNIYQRRPYMPFSRLAACANSPDDRTGPYAQEPFLYSIPRFPPHIPFSHGRSQSEILPVKLERSMAETADYTVDASLPHSPTDSYLTSPKISKGVIDVYASYVTPTPLTDAFQNSVSSGVSFSSASFPPSPADSVPTSLPDAPAVSIQESSYARSTRLAATRRRETYLKGPHPTGVTRTSAAAPVLSFALAELDSTGLYPREARVGRGKPRTPPSSTLVTRARSPYPLVRGRRNSVLRERSMRFSDDDISGTLKYDRPHERFGLEKYLPAGMQKKNVKDENAINDVLVEKERGRTRSRARGGLRL
ncbi:hypothetical protein EIP91_007038 [Steccherinum ochraceum]|uniref:Uncharacterized protein n=1 Tax=Steccherinum ochraceum TaxID=92696 RepID=A0A4R0R4Q8_9APHY|nr:hypothetical protein EIP91_007038 [Steccherinum ochraceum]